MASHVRSFVVALATYAILVSGCSGNDGLDRPTFESDGRTFSVTACPLAANLVVGGPESADALPAKGQTDKQRVESLMGIAREYFLGPTYAGVNMVRRDGEVWYRSNSGGYAVEDADDYQIEVLLTSADHCPVTPASWSGIPLLFNVEE